MNASYCPFCGFVNQNPYVTTLHVETVHSEGAVPWIPRELAPPYEPAPEPAHFQNEVDDDDDMFAVCPHPQCAELIPLDEFDMHAEMHILEREGSPEPGWNTDHYGHTYPRPAWPDNEDLHTHDRSMRPQHSKRAVTFEEDRRKRRQENHKQLHRHRPEEKTKRRSEHNLSQAVPLGKAELGPYAHENEMPAWLRQQLVEGARETTRNQIRPDGTLERVTSNSNEQLGCLQVIANLCAQDKTVDVAFLCSPAVRHTFKSNREGAFCGYRNIQMMISYLRYRGLGGQQYFTEGTPGILQLQDMIEYAWDQGFNPNGRIETGGIRGTRKYIGTSEAQALFQSCGIACEAEAISGGGGKEAYEHLLDAVVMYFTREGNVRSQGNLYNTQMPPIYLQHNGHSLTIIGLEKRINGPSNLLVFDPMFKPSPAFCRMIGNPARTERPEEYLRAYRRGRDYLDGYHAFETLQFSSQRR